MKRNLSGGGYRTLMSNVMAVPHFLQRVSLITFRPVVEYYANKYNIQDLGHESEE